MESKKPEPNRLWFFALGSGAQTRTGDLRVMSPTSCHCSTPQRSHSLSVRVLIIARPNLKRQGLSFEFRTALGFFSFNSYLTKLVPAVYVGSTVGVGSMFGPGVSVGTGVIGVGTGVSVGVSVGDGVFVGV